MPPSREQEIRSTGDPRAGDSQRDQVERQKERIGEKVVDLLKELGRLIQQEGGSADILEKTLPDLRAEVLALTVREGLAAQVGLEKRKEGAFISYSSSDRIFVSMVRRALNEQGVSTFHDVVPVRRSPAARGGENESERTDQDDNMDPDAIARRLAARMIVG